MVSFVHPPALSLPQWRADPPGIDTTGTSFFVIAFCDLPSMRDATANSTADATRDATANATADATAHAIDEMTAATIAAPSEADAASATIANTWLTEAEQIAPTEFLSFAAFTPDTSARLTEAFAECVIGSRILIVGGQYDVLRTLALARECGALVQELSSYVTSTTDLPLYCAHCRATSRVIGEPGGEVDCPGCNRRLEIHSHMSEVRGSFLASDVRARDLV